VISGQLAELAVRAPRLWQRPRLRAWAYRLLQAAGYEATLTEAAYALELAARLIAVPASAVAGAARRHPLAALGIGAAIALVAYQAGYLKRDRLRAAGQEIRRVAATGIEAFGKAADAYGKARQALRVIEPYSTPTVEELAARHLARVRRAAPRRPSGSSRSCRARRIHGGAARRNQPSPGIPDQG